ncbi:MAG: MFS transporter [Clostridia bacterium]|nr:MFS transporter [Clostridia bacterium]
MKKIKGWKLIVYAMAGLGPNLLMTLVTGYLNDALLAPSGLDVAKTFTGTIIVSAGLSSILFFIAKILDAFIDVPLAYFSDRLHVKMNRRAASILIGWVPMVVSFYLMWHPNMFLSAGTAAVTWIEGLLLVVFYSSYTLCMVSYYGTFSSITEDEKDGMRLSHYKAFFDTVQYCVAYALFPALLLKLLGGTEAGAISSALTMLFPMMITMLIPVVMIRNDKNAKEEKLDTRVPFIESLRISLKSRAFRSWLFTLLLMHMGLMLFLTGIGTTIPDSLMGISGWQITVMNSAAFAPVPLMLILFNIFKKKRGHRFALQTALIAFAVAMFTFAASWKQFWGGSSMISFLIGITASTIGSYGVGVFFSSSYYYPSRIAANEIKETGRDHSSMYFAIQGLVTQLASAVGVSLIYMNLVGSEISLFGMEGGQFFLVPAIAGVLMVLGAFAAFSMDKKNTL